MFDELFALMQQFRFGVLLTFLRRLFGRLLQFGLGIRDGVFDTGLYLQCHFQSSFWDSEILKLNDDSALV